MDFLTSLIIKLLKMQTLGGFKGYLLKKLVKEFSEEIVETFELVTDYKLTKERLNDTAQDPDRNRATDNLNQWL